MAENFTKIQKDGYTLYLNRGGPALGSADEKHVLVIDGFAFKDLNRNGVLDAYEDWRIPWEDRIGDLALEPPDYRDAKAETVGQGGRRQFPVAGMGGQENETPLRFSGRFQDGRNFFGPFEVKALPKVANAPM